MVHDALDELFAQPPDKRNKHVLHDLFRSIWLKKKDKYVEELFPTVESQRAFGLAGLKLLSNYFKVCFRCVWLFGLGLSLPPSTCVKDSILFDEGEPAGGFALAALD